MCDWRGDGNRTYVVREHDMPLAPWKLAALMNESFRQGYLAAQADMRTAIGIDK